MMGYKILEMTNAFNMLDYLLTNVNYTVPQT